MNLVDFKNTLVDTWWEKVEEGYFVNTNDISITCRILRSEDHRPTANFRRYILNLIPQFDNRIYGLSYNFYFNNNLIKIEKALILAVNEVVIKLPEYKGVIDDEDKGYYFLSEEDLLTTKILTHIFGSGFPQESSTRMDFGFIKNYIKDVLKIEVEE